MNSSARARRRIAGVTASIMLATVATSLTAPPPEAHADTDRALELEGFFDMQVDEAHGHVFISQDAPTDELIVTDLTGKPVRVITGMGGARGMVLSEDGTRLFVGLASDRAIAEIDTVTLDVVEEHPLPDWTAGAQTASACPHDLVRVGGLVLFGDDCPRRFGAFRFFDPATGEVVLTHSGPEVSGDSRLVLSAEHDILLALGHSVYSFDIVGGGSPSVAYRGFNSEIGPARDLAVLPGTDRFVLDSGEVLDIHDMSILGAYGGHPNNTPTQPEPETVAARTDGVVAFGLHRYSPAGDLRTYATTSRLMRDYYFVDTDDPIFQDERLSFRPRSLEFGERRLYGIEFADRGTEARFWAIKPREATVLKVSTPRRRYDRGALVTVDVDAVGPIRTRRGVAWIERWDRNEEVSGRVRFNLNRRGHGTFQFRIRAKSTVWVTVNDDGDLVYKAYTVGLRR